MRKGEPIARAPGQTWGKLGCNFCISSAAMGCSCPQSLPPLYISMSAVPYIPDKGLLLLEQTQNCCEMLIFLRDVCCKLDVSFFLFFSGFSLAVKGDCICLRKRTTNVARTVDFKDGASSRGISCDRSLSLFFYETENKAFGISDSY